MNGRMATFFSKRSMSVKAGNTAIIDYCTEKGIAKSHHQYVSQNWNQFTSWLDNKIRSEVYKGKVVSTVNPSTWSKEQREKYYAAEDYKYKKKVRKQFDDFYAALTDDEKAFLKKFKSFVKQDNWLNLIRIYTGQIFNEPCPKEWDVTIRLVKLANSRKEEFWTAVKQFKRYRDE